MIPKSKTGWFFLVAQVSLMTAAVTVLPFEVTRERKRERIEFPRPKALVIEPLHDFPDVASDDAVRTAAIKIVPRFGTPRLRPNFLEHALRVWGTDVQFKNRDITAGSAMVDFLTQHEKFLEAWGREAPPLLNHGPIGPTLRVVGTGGLRGDSASRHHDHTLACLSEAGVPLDWAFETPRIATMEQALRQAIDDFRVDERETEWSALTFALWLPPRSSWKNGEGREVSFDLLAKRLLRGPDIIGVCNGTHRLYTLNVLLRVDRQMPILTPEVRSRVHEHLKDITKTLVESQHPDGYWTDGWPDGEAALARAPSVPLYRKMLVTGHQLEWLALAEDDLLPPREVLAKAGKWLSKTIAELEPELILSYYTFSTHACSSLALWRSKRLPQLLADPKVQAALAAKPPAAKPAANAAGSGQPADKTVASGQPADKEPPPKSKKAAAGDSPAKGSGDAKPKPAEKTR
jgi:hypothetical protein